MILFSFQLKVVLFLVDDVSSSSGLRFPAPHTPPSNPLTPASPHTATGGGGSQGFLQSPPSIRQPSPAMPPHASPGELPGSQMIVEPFLCYFNSPQAAVFVRI